MAIDEKDYDCVEMKHKAQKEIVEEYEARKHEFSSYGEYLEASIKETPWTAEIWERFAGKKGGEKPTRHALAEGGESIDG